MENIHRHSYYSNIYTPDSAASNEEYAKRAIELGHHTLGSMEHGWAGNYFQTYELAKKYGLKPIIGAEAYWVKNRFDKDRSNHHILILAKSNQGREAMNDILSEANISGYYYRPRVDLELLMQLPPKDVMLTSACIAFSGYEDIDDIILQLHNRFESNFFLEVQYHNTEKQKDWNKHLLGLADRHNISLIMGMDSHYILPEDSQLRDYILEAKDTHYEDEVGWYMDYPDEETARNRFLEQDILTPLQIDKAISNTEVVRDFCDYEGVKIFTKDIKLPTLYPNLTQEQKNKKYSQLITKKFKEYMKKVPASEYQRYFDGVNAEFKTYRDTGMVDYPLLDYEIIKDAVEHGGLITDTGRGSAVGFFTNTLCGFSKVDRFTSAIKLYPERFISTTRILESKSLPDIDMNCGNVEVFEESQKRVLGEDHAAPMIAFGTLKKKSAFKLYAKAKGMDFELANTISAQIDKYDEAVKNAGDEGDEIDIYEYVDPKYSEYIEQSKDYWGTVVDKKKAPSAYLLYQGNIRREIGLIKCKSESTKKEYITCCMDGAVAEKFKFLKNDLLKVDVVLLIARVFERIGIEHFDVNELIKRVQHDQSVWDLYANGYTVGINQVEKEGSRQKCMRYKPSNISELSAFVAAIRPGFKSMYKRFENREDFSWGIPTLDNLLRTEELPVSFLFFQEQVMAVLNYAGFPMGECYGAIKNIAKKHPEKVRPLKQKFIDGFRERLIEDENLKPTEAQESAEAVWQIINDNCGYGFNCISGNTILQRGSKNDKFVPTVEEMYKIRNSLEYAKATGHLALRKKYRRYGYGQALSMFPDGKIRLNRIVGIQEAGIRKTFTVTTKSGAYITCTDNHKIPTPNGEKELKELKVGDIVYRIGSYKHKYFDTSLTDGNYESNAPQKGQQGFQSRPDGDSVTYNNAVNYCKTNRLPCELCNKPYNENERFELHHFDMNRHHNENSNYEWLCCSCHKIIHYHAGRSKRYDNGIEALFDEIVSIEYAGEEMTYDLEMDDPAHNFVSESGLVTSNSAHAYCMALDSLYQAWQKAHYPYEFYEVLLNHYANKGKKDKVLELKKEMKIAFNISEGAFKFRNDNRRFVAVPEKHQINPALASIKGISNTVAEDLYALGQQDISSFIDLLDALKGTSVKSDVLTILIKIGYFEEFGGTTMLLQQVEQYNAIRNKKQLKVEKLNEIGLPLDLVKQYARITDSGITALDFDDKELLQAWFNTTVYQPSKKLDLILNELEIIGYSYKTIERASEDIYIVEDGIGYNNKILVLYQVKTGQTMKIKCRNGKNKLPVKGDVIRIYEIAYEHKKRLVDDKWVNIEEKEYVLKKYSFLI